MQRSILHYLACLLEYRLKTMATPECSIIIPVFNQIAYTRQCLAALYATLAAFPHEIVIVDNGSNDGSGAFLKESAAQHGQLKIVSFAENRGFSQACNEGAKQAIGEFLLFLNNDTVPQPGWLAPLLEVGRTAGVGVVGSKLLYPDSQTINHAGYVYNRDLGGFYPLYHRCAADFWGVNKRRDYQALLGACILIKKDLFMKIGMFNDYGLEDIDLCLKVREAGLRVVYEPRSVVLHYGSVTLANSPKETIPERGTAEFNRRWPSEKLLCDDIHYYAEDGFKAVIKNGVIELEPLPTK